MTSSSLEAQSPGERLMESPLRTPTHADRRNGSGCCTPLLEAFRPVHSPTMGDTFSVFAVLTAVIPTAVSGEPTTTRSILHGAVAVLFFACIAYVCIWRAADTLSLVRDTRKARKLRKLYPTLGLVMILSPLAAVGLSFLLAADSSVLFFVEAFAVWVFALYWVVKSLELKSTNAEHLALGGEISTFVPLKASVPGRVIRTPYHVPAPVSADPPELGNGAASLPSRERQPPHRPKSVRQPCAFQDVTHPSSQPPPPGPRGGTGPEGPGPLPASGCTAPATTTPDWGHPGR